VPACILKSENIGGNGGRFELDLANLFLFSSNQPGLMPGNILLRTVRVENHFATDEEVLKERARDRIDTSQDDETMRKVNEQRKGLSLATLFAKPRPIWSTPALIGVFGDAFIENTGFDGSSCLSWSYQVMNHAMQTMLRNTELSSLYFTGLSSDERAAISDTLHILSKSAPMFKQMARLIKSPNTAQLLGFLRKSKKSDW